MTAETSSINIRPGDTIKVWQKIKEGDKTRLQVFEGLVIARKHGNEPGATFTVRRMFGDIGVERIFPLYSPNIDKIETISHSKTRRAKLYYIRAKAAKAIRKKMKQVKLEAKKPVQKETQEEKISTIEEK
jgi:large subunit ribosomal protein L19